MTKRLELGGCLRSGCNPLICRVEGRLYLVPGGRKLNFRQCGQMEKQNGKAEVKRREEKVGRKKTQVFSNDLLLERV